MTFAWGDVVVGQWPLLEGGGGRSMTFASWGRWWWSMTFASWGREVVWGVRWCPPPGQTTYPLPLWPCDLSHDESGVTPPPSWTEWVTHACENISFVHFATWAITSMHSIRMRTTHLYRPRILGGGGVVCLPYGIVARQNPDKITDRCKSITFPQLRLRAVKNGYDYKILRWEYPSN